MFLGRHKIPVSLIYSPKQSSHQVATVATPAATEESSEVGVMQICNKQHIHIFTIVYIYIILHLKFTVFFMRSDNILWCNLMQPQNKPIPLMDGTLRMTGSHQAPAAPEKTADTEAWQPFDCCFLKRAMWERWQWCLMGMMGTIASWMVPNVFGSS